MATSDHVISQLGQMIARGEDYNAGPVRVYLDMEALKGAILRIAQLDSALRVAYGQVKFYRKEAKRAWDGDYVRVVCEAAMRGESEPGDDWREKLRAAIDHVSAPDLTEPDAALERQEAVNPRRELVPPEVDDD